jgi:hypothetical protein
MVRQRDICGGPGRCPIGQSTTTREDKFLSAKHLDAAKSRCAQILVPTLPSVKMVNTREFPGPFQ